MFQTTKKISFIKEKLLKIFGIVVFLSIDIFQVKLYSNPETQTKKVLVGPFRVFKSTKEPNVEEKIQTSIKEELIKKNYQIEVTDSTDREKNLKQAQKNGDWSYVEGYYTRNENGNLEIFVQIYNPETGNLIDVISISDRLSEIEDIKLDPNEIKRPDETAIKDATQKSVIRIRSNIYRKPNFENISSFQTQTLAKEVSFPIEKEDTEKASEEVFKLLSEKEDIVVSVSKFAQKTSEAPADITVINRDQIRRYGFRNLSEALNHVPQVYSHWVGQNWSADFRGLFINNQIERRVLYLQDGKKLNDYFHFGEFYSDVFTDMERIEKIEVIKGPGAALYGNNSITGVVNVITREPTKKNEMELITEYDSVLRIVTGRAFYFSKFSDKFSVSLDVSKFEGKGYYESGFNSWGRTRFYDPRTGSTSGTSEYGRDVAPIYTDQRIWFSTGYMASNGKSFPNFNLNIKYGDWNLKSFYMSKRTSWIPPQVDAGAFGGDTVYGSPRNDRIWAVGALLLDYTPSYLKDLEASFRVFRQLNLNSDYRDKDFEGFASATPRPGENYGANPTARLTNQNYINYIAAHGGGLVKRYASTAWADGIEFQLTPYKFESKTSNLKNLRYMIGGNLQAVKYINYQGMQGRNGYVERRAQGIADDGRQYGFWNQLTMTFRTETSLILGARYDAQKIYNVYRHQNGYENDIAYESITEPFLRNPVTGGRPFIGPGSTVNVSTPVRDRQGNTIAFGYVQPFQRKNFTAEDITPRIAVVQNFPKSDTTIKLMYSEAFRMVTPQELIRLPRDQGNAESEKVYNKEINVIQGFLKSRLYLNLDYFNLKGSTIYAFNAAATAFSSTPGWENTGGSASVSYRPDNFWRVGGSFTSYKLRRPSDVSFLNVFFTPPPQALNSPTKLIKLFISRSILDDKYSIALEFYYNNEIHLMQNPPANFTQTRNSDGSYYDLMPLEGERTNASTYFGPGVGQGITRYRVWKVPESKFFNLTFSSNIGNDLILVISGKNIFNQKVFYPLDIESGSFTNPTQTPYQLRGFGREVFIKLGYRF